MVEGKTQVVVPKRSIGQASLYGGFERDERVIHGDVCRLIPDRGNSQLKDPENEACFFT